MRCLYWADAMYSWHWLGRWENGSTEERNYLIIRIPGENQRAVRVSEWLLLKNNSAIFQLYHGENKLIFNEIMIKFALFQTNKLSWFVIALVHCNNCLRVDMSLHSDTLFWFRANQSLFLLLHAAWLAEKQQIPILKSLVWHERGSNPRSTTLRANILTINHAVES